MTGAEHPMHLRLVTLAFAGPDADLERTFLDDYFRGGLRQLRIALVLGALMYGAYAMLDHLMFPALERSLWAVRFGLVCPMILLVAAATFSDRFECWMQPRAPVTSAAVAPVRDAGSRLARRA